MKPEIRTRLALIHILSEVLQNCRSLTPVLQENLVDFSDSRDRAFIQFCAYGICRDYFRLEAIIKKLVSKPIKEANAHYLLLIGLYQMMASRSPDFAIINSAVDTAKRKKMMPLTGFINGVLRTFQREKENILAEVQHTEIAKYAHPEWLIKKIKTAWPDNWENICLSNNEQPPLWLRINTSQISPEAFYELLEKKDIKISEKEKQACCLLEAIDVQEIPGFSEGWVSVQDKAAQYAAELLDPKPGYHILDACAAPGGKTMHLLEKEPEISQVIALDQDSERLKRIKENAIRLHISSSKLVLMEGDASTPDAWWSQKLFDRILLDAPCSATGVIRRHPDIKLLRRKEDISALAKQQANILKALWPLLKVGGKLVYATCSILPEENEKVVADFCKQEKTAHILPINIQVGRATPHGHQILPGEQKMDGFFYAVLEKGK